ncbi:hypothetical protein NL676_018962 [Syzygium grande]|nr:hypothetical protein NL676_018962 [Syzygium grande]
MESSSRFLFRDHQDTDNSTLSDVSTSISSSAHCDDDDDQLQSMTAKGIKHLHSELIELKAASDEEFHQNIYSNYSTFVRVFEEVEGIGRELVQLKDHASNQKRLVEEFMDGLDLEMAIEDAMEPIPIEHEAEESILSNNLQAHVIDVRETLDILLMENRVDEAVDILELEDRNFAKLHAQVSSSPNIVPSYKSMISERKVKLVLQLTQLAQNQRITAPELHKALIGLRRLGNSNLAIQLSLQYHHSRIAAGMRNLQQSKSLLNEVYIRELSKLAFSLISQAARSFAMLQGDVSGYGLEFIRWAHQEVKAFVAYFDEYIKSASEISGGLSIAMQSMQFALSYCSLLEMDQQLVLRPYLIEQMQPHMEEVLAIHVDHFKKVVDIITATDTWILGKYLVSGILAKGYSLMEVGHVPEYCFLTNSGRKFITLLQMLFLELREIEKLARADTFEHSWVMELLRELTEAIFSWMSNEETNSDVDDDNATIRYPKSLPQLFILDAQFVAEMAARSGCFSQNSSDLIDLLTSAHLSAGLDPQRDPTDNSWAITAAGKAVEKLMEMENNDDLMRQCEDAVEEGDDHLPENQLTNKSSPGLDDSTCITADDSSMLEESSSVGDALEVPN